MQFDQYKRIVIKVGSALLINQERSKIRRTWLRSLISDIAELKKDRKDIIIVSSGAIAIGRSKLKFPKGALTLAQSQAAAIMGQPYLIGSWEKYMHERGLAGGQVLLTKSNFENPVSSENARQAINTVLALNGIPIANENDAVATDEIKYGDNDQLGAYTARLVGADLLILLSDINGLYTGDPTKNANAQHIPHVDEITPQIQAMAGEAASEYSRGGMRTKVMAAQIAMNAGCDMIIASGKINHPISAIKNGGLHTLFRAKVLNLPARGQNISAAPEIIAPSLTA